jgi:hypothetical protein
VGGPRLHTLELVEEHVGAVLGHVQAEEHHQAPQELAIARRRQLLEPAKAKQPHPDVRENTPPTSHRAQKQPITGTELTKGGTTVQTVPERRW